MVRPGSLLLALPLALLLATGCATYKQDLERAQRHYDDHKYESALALFRVLEPDLDSLATGDRARYAYLRGMTDFRLSSLAAEGSAMADPRKAFRAHARHWLAIAAAIEKETPGGIADDEKKRLADALDELNRDVYGGADTTPAEGDEKADTAKAKDAPAEGPPKGEPTPKP